MKSSIMLSVLVVGLIALQSCATIFNQGKQETRIVADDSTTITLTQEHSVIPITEPPIKGYDNAYTKPYLKYELDRHYNYTLVVKGDSTTAKTTMESTLDPKWIGYNTLNYEIGTLLDISSGKIYSHQDVQVLQFPRDSSLVEDYSSPYFQSRLKACKTYEQGNQLVEDSRKELPFMAKWLAAFGVSFLIPFVLLKNVGGFTDGEALFSTFITGSYLGLLGVGAISLLGEANNECGSFGPAIGAYYGGFYLGEVLGILGLFAYAMSSPSDFDSLSFGKKLNIYALGSLPFSLGALFATMGYNKSRPRYILARPNSLKLADSITEPYTRSFSFDLPSIGMRLLQTPTLQLVPAVTLNFLQVHF